MIVNTTQTVMSELSLSLLEQQNGFIIKYADSGLHYQKICSNIVVESK